MDFPTGFRPIHEYDEDLLQQLDYEQNPVDAGDPKKKMSKGNSNHGNRGAGNSFVDWEGLREFAPHSGTT